MQKWRRITVSVPEEDYLYARRWAAERDLSISGIFTRFLQNLPYGKSDIRQARYNPFTNPPTLPPTPLEHDMKIYDALGLNDEERTG
jgi:hypothetical protein